MALTRKERTLGCLWAMACGDALGVPSSFLTPEQIKSKYGWIDTFYPPEKGHIFHDGLLAGEYTDDTEQSMALMNAYIRDKQVVPMSVVKEIIAWADRVKDKYASPLGPSTERALKNIAAGGDITVSGKWGNTNGSSMRIAPLGIIHGLRGSTLQELARDVALTDLATHNTRVCNAAATAIAWGAAQAQRWGAVVEIGSYHALLASVAAGMGVGLLPRSVLALCDTSAVVVHDLPPVYARQTTWLVSHSDGCSPALAALRACLGLIPPQGVVEKL